MKYYRNITALILCLLLAVPLSIPAMASAGTELEAVCAELEYIPEPVLQSFEERGWSLRMDPEYLARLSREYGYTCVAATSYKDKTIYLSSADSLVHEFGHFLHYTLDFDKATETLFQKEAREADFLRAYARRNFREYFADCFAYWVENREDSAALALMWEQVPETCQYFMELEYGEWELPLEQIE